MGERITREEETSQIRRALEVGRTEPKAISARYQAKTRRFVVDLESGVTFLFPADLAEGLAGAAPTDLAQVVVSPGGLGLYWEDLDVDLSITGLLVGIFGSPSWMRQVYADLGRKGGSRTTPAKARAARVNGKLGGRPRQKVG